MEGKSGSENKIQKHRLGTRKKSNKQRIFPHLPQRIFTMTEMFGVFCPMQKPVLQVYGPLGL